MGASFAGGFVPLLARVAMLPLAMLAVAPVVQAEDASGDMYLDAMALSDNDWMVATDRTSGCTLEVPALFVTQTMPGDLPADLSPWGSATMTWSGACIGGKASGNGVARMISKGKVQGAWYGDTEGGRMTVGVIEDDDGVQAGRWNRGRLESVMDQPALDKALIAVRMLAANFRAQRNPSSASYYDGRIDLIESLRHAR